MPRELLSWKSPVQAVGIDPEMLKWAIRLSIIYHVAMGHLMYFIILAILYYTIL